VLGHGCLSRRVEQIHGLALGGDVIEKHLRVEAAVQADIVGVDGGGKMVTLEMGGIDRNIYWYERLILWMVTAVFGYVHGSRNGRA
jgi:hypothetical protein